MTSAEIKVIADAFLRTVEARVNDIVDTRLRAKTGVVPGGPYGSFSVDSQGRVTSAGIGVAALIVYAVTSAVQAIPDSSGEIINFDTIYSDPRSTITTGVNWKFTAPVNGYYLFFVSGEMETATWTGDLLSVDLTNITGFSGASIDFQYPSGTNIDVHWHGHGMLYFAAADEGFIGIRQEQGGSLNLQADASIVILKVG